METGYECPKCRIIKPLSEYPPSKTRRKQAWCTSCGSKYRRKHRTETKNTGMEIKLGFHRCILCGCFRQLSEFYPSYVKVHTWYCKTCVKQRQLVKTIRVNRPCTVCGQPMESAQKRYCMKCAYARRLEGKVTRRVSCRTALSEHKRMLADDPERLPTEFIRKISRCSYKAAPKGEG